MNTKYVRNCDREKNEITKHCREADHNFRRKWDQKKFVDRESSLIPKMVKKNYIFTEES